MEAEKTPESMSLSSERISAHNKRLDEGSEVSSAQKKARGACLIGLAAQIWWEGENQYFSGLIEAYNEQSDRYRIVYEDGDMDDDMELRDYEVIMDGNEIDYIRIDEHNMDDTDEEKE